jgi:cAMP-dependent protein kinase regulator
MWHSTILIRLNDILSKAFLFTSLNQQQRSIIVSAMVRKEFDLGSKIIEEGDEGNCLYIVSDGELDCSKKVNSSVENIRVYKTGDLFGELALLYNCPRMASITAQSKCTLWSLDREAFNLIVI